jgi:transmembrane sensor
MPAAVRAEAAAWVARLHGASQSQELQAGLRRWLAADPVNARAFELATEAWDIGGSVFAAASPRRVDRFDARPRRRFVWSGVAAAAAMVMLIAGVFAYLWSPAVTTSVGEQRLLTLEDGSRILLNTSTRLRVDESVTERRVRLDSGEALFDVARNPERPFIVTAGDRQVVALGTSFVVRRQEQQVTVTLIEGKVAVTPAVETAGPREKTVLMPGQRLRVAKAETPRLDQPPIEAVTAWRRGEVILDKTRLGDAVAEMNRYSAIELVIDDERVAGIPISGIFRAGDSASFARAVGEVYRLHVINESRRIVIAAAAKVSDED